MTYGIRLTAQELDALIAHLNHAKFSDDDNHQLSDLAYELEAQREELRQHDGYPNADTSLRDMPQPEHKPEWKRQWPFTSTDS